MKPTGKLIALAAPALVAALAAAADAQQKIRLQAKYLPGTYLVTTKSTTHQTITANGTDKPAQHVVQETVMKLTIGEPDAKGSRRVVITYERFKQEINDGGRVVRYDSAAPADKQPQDLAKIFSVLKKAKIEGMLDKDNNITDVSGLDELWDRLARENERIRPMINKMRPQMGSAMIEDMFRQNTVMLTTGPVSVGERWSNDFPMDLPIFGTVKTSIGCKLDSVKREAGRTVASISWFGTLETDTPAKKTIGEYEMTLDRADMKQTGTADFDVDKGMVTNTVVNQVGEIGLQVVGPDAQTVSMQINQKVEMKTSFKPYAPRGNAASSEGESGGQ